MTLEKFLLRYFREIDADQSIETWCFKNPELIQDLKPICGLDPIEEFYHIVKGEFTAKVIQNNKENECC